MIRLDTLAPQPFQLRRRSKGTGVAAQQSIALGQVRA